MRTRRIFGLALLLAMAGRAATAPAQTAAPPITVQRLAVPAVYTPGQTISVTVTIQKNDARDVQAIAVQDTIPDAWTYQNVSAINPSMTPIKSPEVVNANGTKTLSFYYINIPAFPIAFTYRVTTGAADTGALSIAGLAKFRFTGAEEQSPLVTTPVLANPSTEGETPAEGEGESGPGTGCNGCNQTAKNFGATLGDLFASGVALLTLLALSRKHG